MKTSYRSDYYKSHSYVNKRAWQGLIAHPADNVLIVRSRKNKKLLSSLARRTAIGGFPR